jgi:hypothetical protein
MRMLAYTRERIKRWYDKRLKKKDFKEGNKVLLYNSSIKTFGKGNCEASGMDLILFIRCSPTER